MISFGAGYAYGKKEQFQTDVFFGFVPEFKRHRNMTTIVSVKVIKKRIVRTVRADWVFSPQSWRIPGRIFRIFRIPKKSKCF